MRRARKKGREIDLIGAALCLILLSSGGQAFSLAGASRPAAGIGLSPERVFYTLRESVALTAVVQSYYGGSVLAYLAFQRPDGRLFFYSAEDGAVHEALPEDSSTWTPLIGVAVPLSAGTHVTAISVPGDSFDEPGIYMLYAGLVEARTGIAVSPVAVNHVTVFRKRVNVVEGAIHVGDEYDPYMAGWEEPYPEGVAVSKVFYLDGQPEGEVGIQGEYFATYYSFDPVYLDGVFLGDLPGELNASSWRWAYASVSAERFRAGKNVLTFASGRHPATGHWDDYMVKEVTVYYN